MTDSRAPQRLPGLTRTWRRATADSGDDGRVGSGAIPGPGAVGSAAAAEERASQSSQRREERDPRALAPTCVRGVARGQLPHQQRRLRGIALRDDRAAQHREMAVEARTRRPGPAGNSRHSRPASHRYLFHVTPHPYEGTRPGQVNPIPPRRHPCIPGAGLSTHIRRLTTVHRLCPIPGRVGQGADDRTPRDRSARGARKAPGRGPRPAGTPSRRKGFGAGVRRPS